MIAAADNAKRVWTEAELQALPEDGFIHEVVNGEPGFRYPIADLFKEWDWE